MSLNNRDNPHRSLVDNAQPICIGHRGAMGHATENSLASIRAALELGVRYIEVDVYQVEGELVLFHDHRVERLTHGSGRLVDYSLTGLRQLRLPNDEPIPTLAAACQLIDRQACLNIELKGPDTAAPVCQLVEQLIEQGWSRDAFLISSFDHRQLAWVRNHHPQTLIGMLIYGLPLDDAASAEQLGAMSIHPSTEFIDRQLVDNAHQSGLRVFAYTANHSDEITRLSQLGVDGIFTNFPELIVPATTPSATRLSWTKSDR